MNCPALALCAIGNALVDIIISTDDTFLALNNVAKGAMCLVDDATSRALCEKAGAAVEMSSGGSAANTLAGFASLGGTSAYLGKVGRDEFGDVFTRDLHAQKIQFATDPSEDQPTGRCIVLVTPDAQRSMNTFLGAAVDFGPEDVNEDIVRNAAVTYLEGYLFDKPNAQEAFRKAAHIAHDAGRKLALTLSDSFCVSRHRASFQGLVQGNVDILFANEDELKQLYETTSVHEALQAVRAHTDIAVVTRGAAGSTVVSGEDTWDIPAVTVREVIDTTGAGDLYAAGFLFGVTERKTLTEAAHFGAIAAGEVISHYGPRPQRRLKDLI